MKSKTLSESELIKYLVDNFSKDFDYIVNKGLVEIDKHCGEDEDKAVGLKYNYINAIEKGIGFVFTGMPVDKKGKEDWN